MNLRLPTIALIIAAATALLPHNAVACATCFGQSDSPLADGMNAGIFTLMGVITFVLMGVGAFCLFLARRAAAYEALAAVPATSPTAATTTPALIEVN